MTFKLKSFKIVYGKHKVLKERGALVIEKKDINNRRNGQLAREFVKILKNKKTALGTIDKFYDEVELLEYDF